MDPITIATTVANTALTAWELYNFIQDTKVVDDTVQHLAREVEHLACVCDAVKTQLEALAKQQKDHPALVNELDNQETARIGAGIESQLAECNRAMKKLDSAIPGVRRHRSNAITQAVSWFFCDPSEAADMYDDSGVKSGST